MCICSLRYTACNAHAPYCHLLPTQLYNIFPHYLINNTIFEKKKIIERKICVLIFCTTCVWKISHSKKSWARYYYLKYPSVLYLNETRISSTDFRNKNQISWKFFQWEMSCCMREDGQTDMNLILVFRNFVTAPTDCIHEGIKTWFNSESRTSSLPFGYQTLKQAGP